jgi:3-hydroxyisobutyrate dehydrogenase
MEIAFLGTGIMGGAMARNLAAAGHRLRVWNRTRERAQALAGEHVRVAADPAEAVDGAQVVVTMLSAAGPTEEVARDALRCAAAGTIWWQAGTVGLDAVRRLAALAGEHDVVYVDAPVLGTKQPAESGELTVLASGPAGALDTLAPLFGAVGAKTVRAGEEPGAAQRTKLVMNHWVLALTVATAETIRLARALDVDPQRFLDGIAGGPLDSGYAQLKGRAMLEDATDEASFPLGLAAKDSGLILDAAASADLDAPLAEALAARLRAADDAGLGDHDMAAVVRA